MRRVPVRFIVVNHDATVEHLVHVLADVFEGVNDFVGRLVALLAVFLLIRQLLFAEQKFLIYA